MSAHSKQEVFWISVVTCILCVFGAFAGASDGRIFALALLGIVYVYVRIIGEATAKLYDLTDRNKTAENFRFISVGGSFLTLVAIGLAADQSYHHESIVLAVIAAVHGIMVVFIGIFGLYWKSTSSVIFKNWLHAKIQS